MTWVDLDGAAPLRAGWYAAMTRWKTDTGRIPTACWWSGTKWGLADPDRLICFFPQPFESAHEAVGVAFDLEESTCRTQLAHQAALALATSTPPLAAAAG